MITPLSLGMVTDQVDAINALVDGGFSSALSAASSLAAAAEDSGPTVSNAAVGLPTALVVGEQSPTAQAGAPEAQALVNGPMAPVSPATSPGQASTAGGPTGAEAVSVAERYLGVPYVWGGASPSTGFDCSGLVQYVYGQLGVSLPRTSQQQATVGAPVPSLADAEPGDLLFFPGTDGTAESPGHVGIYIGNGEMVDAPYTGATVQVQPVGDPVAIRRVLPSSPQPAGDFAGPEEPVAGTAATAVAPTTTAGPTSPAPYAQLFASATAAYGLPPGLLQSVATAESGMGPDAVSSAGAEGLMQLMPGTAAELGVANPMNPAENISGGVRYLRQMLERYDGNVPLALAAYNAGPGAVDRAGGIPNYTETRAYVAKVIHNWQEMTA